MSVPRALQAAISKDLFKGKILVLLGARQVGKSTFISLMPACKNLPTLWLDAENADVQELFRNATTQKLKLITGAHKVLVIDEAQKIDQVGSVLKLFADYLKEVQVIASGSSAFELRNSLNEPLTGRKFEYKLYPLSFTEMANHEGTLNETRQLNRRLVYGYYPEIVTHPDDAERLLRFLADSYLYKDVLMTKGVKKPEKILDLLKMLAWQIGSEVNYNELSNALKIDHQTVESYINMLEQVFVIYKLPAYHTNQRSELKKSKKIYFNDTGIRNALINDFRPVENRNDAGALFENYMVNELRKQNEYLQVHAHMFFWRNVEQREIDMVFKKNDRLHAFEIKWTHPEKARITKAFTNLYGDTDYTVIHPGNYYEVISGFASHFTPPVSKALSRGKKPKKITRKK